MPWLPRLAARAAIAVAVGVALMLAGGPQGSDRPAVTSTGPAEGATLARAPTEVGLAFAGPVDPDRSQIVVTDGSGAAPARTPGALRRTAPRRHSQPISVTAAGDVTVAYHVTVPDGMALTGSLRFTAASGNDAGEPAPTSGHPHDIDPVSAGLLVADGITALAVVVLLLRRPRRGASGRR